MPLRCIKRVRRDERRTSVLCNNFVTKCQTCVAFQHLSFNILFFKRRLLYGAFTIYHQRGEVVYRLRSFLGFFLRKIWVGSILKKSWGGGVGTFSNF